MKKAEGNSNPSDKEANSPKLPKILNQISLVHFKKWLSLHSSVPVFVSFPTAGWKMLPLIPNLPQTSLPIITELWGLFMTLSLYQ